MKASSEAREALAELERIQACFDAVDDIRAALAEARDRGDPAWFNRWLRKAAREARARESVNHGGPIVNHNVK